jgi:hypothetical protein
VLINGHQWPSAAKRWGGTRRASTVWRQVATGDAANRSHRLPSGGALRGGLSPSGDRWLRATDGEGYATEYPRQDSNRSKKAQGKRHVSKIVPPPVPPPGSITPQGVSELVAIWSALDAHQQAELLRVARALIDQGAELET